MISLFRSMINYLTSGPVVGLELLGENGITRWQELTSGLENCKRSYSTTMSSLRTYEKNEIYNSMYASKNIEIATQVRILICGFLFNNVYFDLISAIIFS